MSEALARLVNDFFADPAVSRGQKERLSSSKPFSRESTVYLNTWRPWVADGGVSLRRRVSFPGIRDERREAALSVLTELEAEGKARRGRLAGVIGRARLEGLSRAASVSDPASLVRLWVATMMWGSGTTNGRGPSPRHGGGRARRPPSER